MFMIYYKMYTTTAYLFFACQYIYYALWKYCVIVSGRIKGAARVTNVMYPCGFICIPAVLFVSLWL